MARSFNGTSDNAAGSYPVAGPAAYTWSLWANGAAPPGTATTSQFFLYAQASDPFGFSWDHPTAGYKQAAYHQDGGGTYRAAQISSALSASTWYHIAATWDGATLTVYLNGAAQGTAAPASVKAASGSQYFGSAGTGYYWHGSLAEFGFWDAALSANEVKALALGAAPAGVRPAHLQTYYPLWGLQSPEPDVSGGGRSLTLSGTAQANHAPVTPWTRKRRAAFPLGGASYAQALSASAASSSALARGVGKALGFAAQSASALARGVAKALAFGAASASALVKGVGKTLGFSAAEASALAAGHGHLLTLAANAASSSALARAVGKGLGFAAASGSALARAVAKGLGFGASSASALTKGVAKLLGFFAAEASALQAQKNGAPPVVPDRYYALPAAAGTYQLAAADGTNPQLPAREGTS